MSPQHAPSLPSTRRWIDVLPWTLMGLTVLVQISWVLASAPTRDALTITSVVLFFSASLTHSLLTQGLRWSAVFFAVVLAFGFAVEAVGVSTGLPFGSYSYGTRLGPQAAGVPLLIALAWAMMAYPCFVVALRATRTKVGVVVLAGILLATWDLFLDPQMVAEGHWAFADPTPALPGSTGTPIVNHLGWLVAGLTLMALAVVALGLTLGPESLGHSGRPRGQPASREPSGPSREDSGSSRERSGSSRSPTESSDTSPLGSHPGTWPHSTQLPSYGRRRVALPAAMLVWVYCSNMLANAVFLGRPLVALVGGIGMGIPMAVAFVGLRDNEAVGEPA